MTPTPTRIKTQPNSPPHTQKKTCTTLQQQNANDDSYHGHSMSDPGSTYRTRDEISSVRTERDPVERVKKLLLGPAAVDPAEVKKIEREAKKTVDSAVEQAKNDPIPPDGWVWRNAYAGDGRAENSVGGGVEVASLEVRNILGDRIKPIFDPAYKD